MSKKKKSKKSELKPARGRPATFGRRVRWLILLEQDVADAVEKWRVSRGLSQSGVVEAALRDYCGIKQKKAI